jgi:PKD repeat protein
VLTVNPATSLAGKRVFLKMTTLDNITGCDTTFGRYMYIPHTPAADFLASDICLGDVAQFKNKSTLAASNYAANYLTTRWEFNDPDASITDDNSDILDGFWEYSTYSAGVNVEMTVVNGLYPKFEYSLTKTINVTPKPEVDFKVLNACEGNNITIVNNTSISTGGAITYAWDFGGVYTSTSANPAYTFATPGQRKVKVVATSNGCTAELTKNAYQFEKPVADFVSEGKCNFVDVLFNSTSSIPNNGNMGYKWDFASEGISRSKSPAFAFATAGSKTVKLTATSEFGCESVITKTIVLDESPVADFTWDAACNLTPINFTRTGSVPNGGINSSMTWDFNGEGTSTGTNDAKHQFPKVGSKLVTLTIADGNGCSNSITKEVNVVLQAVANFDVASVCQGDETQFTGKSSVAAGNLTYNWTFGDGTPASGDHSPKHTYGTSGSYNVTLEAIVAGGCSDVISKAVFVNPAPDATWTFTKAGRNVVLNSTADNNDAYKWTFGDGSRATDANPTYNYDNVDLGTFTICLATRKGICWSEDCKDITVDLAGIADLTESNDMINVYPNPTSGKFTVSVENAGKDAVVKVGDILGNVISARVIDNLNGTYSVDMSAVADGVYFVQVKNGDYFATKRITVSK